MWKRAFGWCSLAGRWPLLVWCKQAVIGHWNLYKPESIYRVSSANHQTDSTIFGCGTWMAQWVFEFLCVLGSASLELETTVPFVAATSCQPKIENLAFGRNTDWPGIQERLRPGTAKRHAWMVAWAKSSMVIDGHVSFPWAHPGCCGKIHLNAASWQTIQATSWGRLSTYPFYWAEASARVHLIGCWEHCAKHRKVFKSPFHVLVMLFAPMLRRCLRWTQRRR